MDTATTSSAVHAASDGLPAGRLRLESIDLPGRRAGYDLQDAHRVLGTLSTGSSVWRGLRRIDDFMALHVQRLLSDICRGGCTGRRF